MNPPTERIQNMSTWLLEKRWLVVGFTILIVVFVEYEEHRAGAEGPLSVNFWREVLLFGLLLPVAYGLLVTILMRVQAAKAVADRTITQKQHLSAQLNRSRDRDSILATIVKIPAEILPVSATTLRIYSPESDRYEQVESWSAGENIPPELAKDIERAACSQCQALSSESGPVLTPCTVFGRWEDQTAYTSYCLPLKHHEEIVALLHLHFTGWPTLSEQDVRALTMAAPEMALSIETARLEQEAQEHLESTKMERQRIAGDLHDTLGQNIGYLRLKLDQLTGEDALRGIGVIRLELERMREIADDAYLQVRKTLADLHPETAADLTSAIRNHFTLVSKRSAFKAHFQAAGKPQLIETHMRNQVMYIFREILNNIEKHAHARNVYVNLDWGPEEFCILVRDDGEGFVSSADPPEGHYGLKIMQERAADLKAQLNFRSEPKRGTQVVLRLPLVCPSKQGAPGEIPCEKLENSEVQTKN